MSSVLDSSQRDSQSKCPFLLERKKVIMMAFLDEVITVVRLKTGKNKLKFRNDLSSKVILIIKFIKEKKNEDDV